MARDRRWRAAVVGGIVYGLAGLYLVFPFLFDASPVLPPGGLPPPPSADAPNVVFVIGCTVRRDQLTPYGGLPTTPFLAELARSGTVFEDALSTSSWTREAAAGLVTGRHAAEWGMLAGGRSEDVLPDVAHTLAERLAARGWETLGITANPNLDAAFGFAQGFSRHQDSPSRAFSRRDRVAAADVAAQALSWIREGSPDRPFYLQLALVDAHPPRDPTSVALARLADPTVSEGVVRYRATLHRLDAGLAALDAGLDAAAAARLRDTLWVFVGDHGEGLSMPDHHRAGHGLGMYGSAVRIPWILSGPTVARGHRVEGLASGIDVVPTVMGLLGLASAPSDGFDWSDQVRGAPRTTRARAMSMSMFQNADVASLWTDQMQCQGDFARGGRRGEGIVTGCFDRLADPTFVSPISGEAALASLRLWRKNVLQAGTRAPGGLVEGTREGEPSLEVLGYRD